MTLEARLTIHQGLFLSSIVQNTMQAAYARKPCNTLQLIANIGGCGGQRTVSIGRTWCLHTVISSLRASAAAVRSAARLDTTSHELAHVNALTFIVAHDTKATAGNQSLTLWRGRTAALLKISPGQEVLEARKEFPLIPTLSTPLSGCRWG